MKVTHTHTHKEEPQMSEAVQDVKLYKLPVYKVQLVREATTEGPKAIRSPKDAADILETYLTGADREHFVVLLMDTKHKVRGVHTASIGGLSAAVVHPRDIFKAAILANSAAVILGHNHPSGDPTPSREDIDVTRRLTEAGKLLGVEVLDSLVVGGEGSVKYVSFREKSLL